MSLYSIAVNLCRFWVRCYTEVNDLGSHDDFIAVNCTYQLDILLTFSNTKVRFYLYSFVSFVDTSSNVCLSVDCIETGKYNKEYLCILFTKMLRNKNR